jgi:hypothetical protein
MWRDVFTTAWTPSNVAGYDVTASPGDAAFVPLTRGWYDSANNVDPFVALTNFDEAVPGSRTGFSGFAGDGSGPTSRRAGTGLVTVFAEARPEAGDDYRNSLSAQDVLYELRTEIEDIAHHRGARPAAWQSMGISDWETPAPSTDDEPVVHLTQATLTYEWVKVPP